MGCCDGFTRARLLKDGAARAGAGLPAIEPGMPAPAGTGLTRRTLLSRALGATIAVYGGSRLGVEALQEGMAHAAAPSDRVLVSVFMAGGVDSLSVLAPVGHSRYATLRPTLQVTGGTPFGEDSSLHWAPAADGLRRLHEAGRVTVLPAVGYTSPDQSHFTSRHFWEVGATDVGASFGWLGRYLDLHGVPDNPLQGLALDSSLAPSLAAAQVPTAAVPEPERFGFYTPGVNDPLLGPTYAAIGTLGNLPTEDPARLRARLVASQVDKIRRDLAPFQGTVASTVTYPSTRFARRLRALAAMLAAGLPVRAVAVEATGGYDTHSNQAATFENDLSRACLALEAFQADLEARGIAGRVLTHVWSEFGRRPQQNETGTDHGAAGVGFVIGTRAAGTQVGGFPGLQTLDPGGNLVATADFRGVYCALLDQWLGVDPGPIIPGADGFAVPRVVAA